MTVALITARGGSTRVPRKNIRNFCGIPLVAWSIIQSRAAKSIDKVYVTTDDEAIANVAEQYGAEVIMRPVWPSGVTAGVAFRHGIEHMHSSGIFPDNVFSMLPTSVLRKPEDLDSMHDIFMSRKLKTITTGVPLKEVFLMKNSAKYQERYGETCNVPGTPTVDKYVSTNWHIYDKFWQYSKVEGGTSLGRVDYQLPIWQHNPDYDIVIDTKPVDTSLKMDLYALCEWQCFDIDYLDDFELCETLMERFILKGAGRAVYDRY